MCVPSLPYSVDSITLIVQQRLCQYAPMCQMSDIMAEYGWLLSIVYGFSVYSVGRWWSTYAGRIVCLMVLSRVDVSLG